jgi:hypothetical protein
MPGSLTRPVYDGQTPDGIGWGYSEDGLHWERGQGLVLQPTPGAWAKEVRTPLGLVPEGPDRLTLFYTGFEQVPDWQRILDTASSQATCAVGFVELRLER